MPQVEAPMAKAKPAIQILLTLALFAWLFSRGDFSRVLNLLKDFPLSYLLISLIGALLVFGLSSWVNARSFKKSGFQIPFLRIYQMNLTALFYALALPGDVAGGAARYLKFSNAAGKLDPEAPHPGSIAILIMAMERILMMAGLSILLTILLFFIPLPRFHSLTLKLAAGLSLFLVLAIVFLKKMPLRWLNKLKWPKIRGSVETMMKAFRTFSWGFLASNILILILYQISAVLVLDVVFLKALALPISAWTILPLALVGRFLRMIPVTYSGLGIREGLYPYFLTTLGVSYEQALLLGLLGSATVIIMSLLGGVLEMGGILAKRRDK